MDRPAIERVALLEHPLRAALYEQLAERDGWLSRDEAAEVAGVPRSVAAFHLDKLAKGGLVDVSYVRTSGRTGPGAGRPSKLYRRSEAETTVSIPSRDYPLVGDLLAQAVERSADTGEPVKKVLSRLANGVGRELAKAGAARGSQRALMEVLRQAGYEPRKDKDEIVLRNCPFHELSQKHAELVCGMNLDLMKGLVRGVTAGSLTPRLDPAPGFCCVRIAPKG